MMIRRYKLLFLALLVSGCLPAGGCYKHEALRGKVTEKVMTPIGKEYLYRVCVGDKCADVCKCKYEKINVGDEVFIP